MNPTFLGLEDIVRLHVDQIERYGGAAGIRDLALLESALAAPRAGFGDVFLHPSLEEMAAAYLFHLARNHPFVDGNKRTAAAATFLFLFMNDRLLDCTEDELVTLTLSVATGAATKASAAVFIAAHLRAIGDP